MTTLSGSAVQPVRARVKSTSSLQQPVVAQHFAIPPPASVPSSRRSTSSLSSTPPTPAAVDTLMPACPTGWARFDLSPLNEVTVDASSSRQTVAPELPAQTSSDTEPRPDDHQTGGNFAIFPSSSGHDDHDIAQSADSEGQLSNDKFSDSFLALRDNESFDDAAKQGDSVVASSSFELMSPSSDKDSVSLPSPEAPPPPLPANVLTTELPSEPPVPPPRPRTYANSGVVEQSAVPVTPSSTGSQLVRSNPMPTASTVALVAAESQATKPPASTSVVSNPSQHISSGPTSRFTVQPSSAPLPVNDVAHFPSVFPSDDATPPPLPPRHFPVDPQKQLLLRGTSLPAAGKIHSVEDVPPPPPPRRSVSRIVTGSQPVDPFAPIPVSVPLSSVSAKQQAVTAMAAATLSFSSNSSVVETTIAPLPRPRPHLRQTQTVADESSSGTVVATSSGNSSPWQSVNTPPVIEPLDPFSNVDPFAGSVSPDDPFAEPSLDGMLSDLCHDFDTDTLSTTAFRTRAVTIDSASSDIYEASSAASASTYHHDVSTVSNESHSSNAANVVSLTRSTEAVGTGCLVDLNTADDADDAKWQPFFDNPTATSSSQAASDFALYGDLQDVWYGGGAVDWNASSASAVPSHSSDVFDSPVSSVAVQPVDNTSSQVSDLQPDVSKLVTAVATCEPCASTEGASASSQVTTDVQSSHCSLQSLSVMSSTDGRSTIDFDDVSSRSARAVSEPPALSQVVSSVEHNDSSFSAAFGQFDDCFVSWPTVSVTANGTSEASAADVAVSNATCMSELSTMSSVQPTLDNKQHTSSTTDQPAQVI